MRRIFEQSNIIFPAGEIMMVSKKINYITGSYTNQMTEVLANIVTDAFGFKDIHDMVLLRSEEHAADSQGASFSLPKLELFSGKVVRDIDQHERVQVDLPS